MKPILSLMLVAGALSISPGVSAQQFPNKPLKFVVAYPPGGATDAVSRILSVKLSASLGQQVVVENRPGAGGNIGVNFIASSAPDGYTMGLTDTGTIAIAPWTSKDLPYHPLRDFTHLALASSQPYLVVAHPSVQVTNLKELVALAKSKPGSLSFASTSQGNELAGELFKMMTETNILHIPYKGGGQAINDLLGGQVNLMFASAASSSAHVTAGKLRALAVTGATRISSLPNVPTAREAGFPDLVISSWYGVAVPAKTPQDISSRLATQIADAFKQPDVVQQLNKLGLIAGGSSGEEFSAFVRAEYDRWGNVVKNSGRAGK